MITIKKILASILIASPLLLSGCAITSAPDTALSTPIISDHVDSNHTPFRLGNWKDLKVHPALFCLVKIRQIWVKIKHVKFSRELFQMRVCWHRKKLSTTSMLLWKTPMNAHSSAQKASFRWIKISLFYIFLSQDKQVTSFLTRS